jgi:MoaA/NifB/PqqE/SkfB family radical SAM enzyme
MAIDWQFYHWHLEPSAVCALKCPRCPRVEHPDTPWLNKNMSLEFFKSFMTEDMLRNNVKRLTMCGDVGDPIYCPDYLDIYEYVKNVDPTIHIFTITNGSHKKTEWWERFASLANEYDSINFSIDGYNDETNNLYRVNSKWDSIINGIKTMRANNQEVFLNWAAIVFSFNQDHLDYIKDMATNLGMDQLQITKSTKFDHKYPGAYPGDTLEPRPEWISSSHRYERHTIDLSGRVQNRNDYMDTNELMYQNIKSKYANSPITPLCEIGNRGVYVNAEGVLFPCSWVSFPYTSLTHESKTIKWDDSFFAQHRDQMNLRNRPFDSIINDPLWNKCSAGWSDPSKTWVECSHKCQTQQVTFDYGVGWETN